MFALADVLDLFAHELAGLSRGRLALLGVFVCPLQYFIARH